MTVPAHRLVVGDTCDLRRHAGLTASEKVLAELCEETFLSLRSYPNLYRKSGKELTDFGFT